jgi:pentatricopeptide repeat protein
MFLSKLFKKEKDHRHYLAKGGKYLADERYADARVEFMEALKACPAGSSQDEQEIRAGLATAGNTLGELNIQEGQHAATAGELEKAFDHFTLAGELAFDQTIKAMAREGLRKLQRAAQAQPAPEPQQQAHGGGGCGDGHHHGGSSCGSCSSTGAYYQLPVQENEHPDLDDEERFNLMVQPLPLAERYLELGPAFAKAYLLIHDGNDAAAFPILKEMLVSADNDIVIYEVALIMYRSGQVHECDKLLRRSLQLNPTNSMTYMALIHLLTETGRLPEAIETVQTMMELEVLPDQAQFMLGELKELAGDEAAAFEAWSKALEFPSVAKAAAERLVPILAKQGRHDEAKYLTKNFLKGCC